jgi:glycosyltransferase involved in cell wall biosynthesis
MIGGIGIGSEVTVILAHYSCPDLLTRAIASIMRQTRQDWRLVIVDDHSPCLSEVIDLRHRWSDDRLVWLRTSINVGQFRIYNRLLPLIASPFLALQDADDWSAPERLNQLLLGIYRRRCDVIGSSVMLIRAGAEPELVAPPFDVNRTLRFRSKGGAFYGSTMLCRTQFLRTIGGFDGTTKIGGDTDFIHRGVFLGSVKNHPDPLYYYNERPESLTQAPSTGFKSKVRKAYTSELRLRHYRNLLRSWTGALTAETLQARPNNLDFQLNDLGDERFA